MQYMIADVFIRIKNAALARRKSVEILASKRAKALLDILQEEGYVNDIKTREEGAKKFFTVQIVRQGRSSMFTDVRIISRPSLRVYADKKDIDVLQKRSVGQIILSTSKGIMTARKALSLGVGGEVLVEVW